MYASTTVLEAIILGVELLTPGLKSFCIFKFYRLHLVNTNAYSVVFVIVLLTFSNLAFINIKESHAFNRSKQLFVVGNVRPTSCLL